MYRMGLTDSIDMALLTFILLIPSFILPAFCHSDEGLNVIQLVRKYGYPIERHRNIKTKDGYLLEMQRIPYGKTNNSVENKKVVLVMHGILSSSVDWVNMGPDKGLSYILADSDFDVWMGNARGNTWSRKHIKYNPDEDEEFWNFSWHEIGVYDLPAMIDYVLKKTGRETIHYLAHSQGATAYFVMCSELPKYNSKIVFATAMAPVGFVKHVRNPFIQLLSKFQNSVEWVAEFLGVNEFFPHSQIISAMAFEYCQDEGILQGICANALFLIGGYNTQLNTTMIPVILSNTPAGSSTKQFLHFAQEVNSGRFCKYDFGWFKNLMFYGSINPPDYNLKKITSPVALFYGNSDILTDPRDLQKLYHKLPNVVFKYKVKDNGFGHLDFMWGLKAPQLLYKKVIQIMKRF